AKVWAVALGIDASGVEPWHWQALRESRFPRVVLLALVGAALAASGAALQSTFRNPMADPTILGVSGGGALGAVLAVRTGLADDSILALTFCAFVGALSAALIVHVLAHVASRPSTTSLLLTGVAVSSLTSACVSLVMVTTDEFQLKNILFWLVGGAEGRSWEHVRFSALPIFLASALLLALHRTIDALGTGEDHALSVGVSVVRSRLVVLSLCALASGAAVAVAGPVAFVGLMVPNGLRLMVGSRTIALLPASVLGGAAFLVLCDLATRVAFPDRVVPVGLLTSLLGVPYFLILLVGSRRAVR
ncbi:MAG: iron ABC transporter permease, partial [Planctomycetes bacterium]|nr:iron ABC transporter permease [Planctomycetota bacterium]